MARKIVFVGLGNPGRRYAGTRHNFGCTVLRAWVEETGGAKKNVAALFPTTMMNNSGEAVLQYVREHNVLPEQMLIIHDDLELPLGEVRRVEGGSAKGHKGVRSIQEALGTNNIPRLRLGIGRERVGESVHDFVLEKFEASEKPLVAAAQAAALELLSVAAENN